MNSPTGFCNAGDLSLIGELPKANPTEIKITHVAVLPTASETTPHDTGLELRLLEGPRNDGFFSHSNKRKILNLKS